MDNKSNKTNCYNLIFANNSFTKGKMFRRTACWIAIELIFLEQKLNSDALAELSQHRDLNRVFLNEGINILTISLESIVLLNLVNEVARRS